MKTLSLKMKIAMIAAVVLLAVGIAFGAIFGLNNVAADKNGYELSVKAEANIGNVSTVLKNATENYLESKGVCVSSVVKYDGGGQYVFNFGKDYKDVIDTAELAATVKTEFDKDEILSGLDVTAKYNETVNVNYSQSAIYITFAAILSVAAIFLCTVISGKNLASALGVVCPSVISALLFFACVGLFRIPAGEFFATNVAVSALFAAVFSFVIADRFKEEIKMVQSGKPDYEIITEKGLKKGLLRICVSAGIAATLGILLFAFGIAGGLKWAGLQLFVAAAVSSFSAITFTGLIYKELKTLGKGDKGLPKTETEQQN